MSRQFGFFFFQKKNIFASSLWKLVKPTWASRMGQNFDDNPAVFSQKSLNPNILSPEAGGQRCHNPPEFADIEKRTYEEVDNILDRSGLPNCWTFHQL